MEFLGRILAEEPGRGEGETSQQKAPGAAGGDGRVRCVGVFFGVGNHLRR